MRPDFGYLVYQLVLRDFRARYKQTFLGALWIFGRPLLELGVFTIVFGAFLRVPTEGVSYPVFAYVGIVLWSFCAGGLSRATRSVTGHGDLVSSTPFPKVAIPLAALASALLDTLLSGAILGILYAAGGGPVTGSALWLLPIGLVLATLVTGLSFLAAALHVFYRDVGQVVDLVVRVFLLLTPVAYGRTIVPDAYRWLYDLNPLVALFESARAALLSGATPDFRTLVYPLVVAVTALAAGMLVFRRAEPFFAESV